MRFNTIWLYKVGTYAFCARVCKNPFRRNIIACQYTSFTVCNKNPFIHIKRRKIKLRERTTSELALIIVKELGTNIVLLSKGISSVSSCVDLLFL
jgi:hypothetical protein